MGEFADWIGRTREAEDEITRPALARIGAMLGDPRCFAPGDAVPAHWYAMFFPDLAPTAGLGPDGHPAKGEFLPPVPLPRRMFAGRRVALPGVLRVGDAAVKRSTITAITPKQGRSGAMVFVTLRHEILVRGAVAVEEEQDVVYREAQSGQAGRGGGASEGEAAPEGTWREAFTPDPVLLFRYSAITFNSHRIHYDADYVRGVEGYPGLVVNGGLTLLMLLEAVGRARGAVPTRYAARNHRPLFAGARVTLSGDAEGAWAADDGGRLAVRVTFG
jgi:3-methylfumaryl-CoA hydratase